MAKVDLAGLLDRACTEILKRKNPLERGTRLLINPAIYRSVADARPQEIERGLPMMLLGLELVPSNDIPAAGFKIAR